LQPSRLPCVPLSFLPAYIFALGRSFLPGNILMLVEHAHQFRAVWDSDPLLWPFPGTCAKAPPCRPNHWPGMQLCMCSAPWRWRRPTAHAAPAEQLGMSVPCTTWLGAPLKHLGHIPGYTSSAVDSAMRTNTGLPELGSRFQLSRSKSLGRTAARRHSAFMLSDGACNLCSHMSMGACTGLHPGRTAAALCPSK